MKTISCSLFPDEADLSFDEKENFEIGIPDDDYDKLSKKAKEEKISVKKLIEQEYFSVSRIPDRWKVKPQGN